MKAQLLPRIPNFGQKSIAARTDYLVNGKHDLTVFLTAAKSNGKEGRIICVRTKDGAKSWQLVSFVGNEPAADDMALMPSSVRPSAQSILTAVRRPGWLERYRSNNDGKSWEFLSKPVVETGSHHGNPPFLLKLADGTLHRRHHWEPFRFAGKSRNRVSMNGQEESA